MRETGTDLRGTYPHMATMYAEQNLQGIASTYEHYIAGIAEKASALQLADLVTLANTNAVSASEFVPSQGGCHGSIVAMGTLIELETDLRPNESAGSIRDSVAAFLEEAAQTAVSRRICDKVCDDIDQPSGLSDATIYTLEKYAPRSVSTLTATTEELYDIYIGNFQRSKPSQVIEGSALAFGHIGGERKINIETMKGTESLTLDDYKIGLLLRDREDLRTVSRKTGGSDRGIEAALEAIEALPLLAFNIKISEEHQPTSLGLKIIAATSHTRAAMELSAKATREGARWAATRSTKTAAVVVIGSLATGVSGVHSASASQYRGIQQDRVASTEQRGSQAGLKKQPNGLVVPMTTVNVTMHSKPPGKHAKSNDGHENNQRLEAYEGHNLTPEIQASLKEIISRDNPWKNRGVATLFFMKNGFTLEQAVGHVGSFMVESKMPGSNVDVNPDARQLGNDVGQGIAQWTKTDRWRELLKFAAKNDLDPRDLITQLEFVMFEYDGPEKEAYRAVKNSNSVEQATLAFLRKYERAGVPHGNKRINNAQKVFDEVIDVAKQIKSKNNDNPAPIQPPEPPATPPEEIAPVVPEVPIVPDAPAVPVIPELPEIDQSAGIVVPTDFVFALPPAADEAEQIVIGSDTIYTPAPAIEPAEVITVPDPTIIVPENEAPTIPEIIEPGPGIDIPTPEQQPEAPSQPPPLPPIPNFVWTPPELPDLDPPDAIIQPPEPAPNIDQIPEVAPTPPPPIVVPMPPENTVPEITPPPIPAPPETIPPDIDKPPAANDPPIEVVPPAPVIPETPEQPTQPTQPEQPEQPDDDGEPKEDSPKPADKPKEDHKPDESDGPKNKIEDSKTDCAPGTVSLGRHKVNDGEDELCAVLGLDSSSQESTPGAKFYLKGANGHAIIRADISDNIVKMLERADKDGINLRLLSSFRTYEHQKELCDNDKNGCRQGNHKYVAKEGKSNHGDAAAFDEDAINANKDNCTWKDGVCTAPHDKEWVWLDKNASDFGFYQYKKEAWHFDTTKR